MENLTTENSHNSSIDPDYSLNEFFESDWINLTKTGNNNIKSQNKRSNSVTSTTETPDPDFTLDEFFNTELIYVPKKKKKMSNSPESYVNNTKYWPIAHNNSVSIYRGFTALHFAAINPTIHKKEIVKSFIVRGADVNAVDHKSRTPLHIAAQIYKKRNEVDFDGKTNIEVMDILLKSQCNIDVRDSDGNTPLLSAFSLNYDEFKIDSDDNPDDDDELHLSVYMPEVKDKLKFFCEHGADLTATNNKNENILHLILENLKFYRCNFHKVNYRFDDSDHLDMLQKIFNTNQNIDVNLKNDKGETPLQMAVACMSSKIVELLLDHAADLNELKFATNGQSERSGFFCYPNMVAIFEPVEDLIKVLDLLSDRGFDLDLPNNITVLDFLLHRDENCDCYSYPYTSIKFALQYGSRDHVVDVLQHLYAILDLYEGPGDPDYLDAYNDERLNGTEELNSDLIDYMDTTELANINRDDEVMQMVVNIYEDILDARFYRNSNNKKRIEKDLNSLKSITFENNVSLFDILQKDPSKTPRSIVNEFNVNMIENLHCYSEAVKGHITKARVRYHFEKYFADYLRFICGPLPDICCRKIANYFDNDDILHLAKVCALLELL